MLLRLRAEESVFQDLRDFQNFLIPLKCIDDVAAGLVEGLRALARRFMA
jgi:hypothetical protein